jgi:methylated-DNA-protein-cysteine methyltransferase related protein
VAGTDSTYKRIYRVIARIPRGRVATYGQVARLAGIPGHARQVGYALHALPVEGKVPWQRVINARGEISLRSGSDNDRLQRMILRNEGVRFDREGRIDLERYRWRPRGPVK